LKASRAVVKSSNLFVELIEKLGYKENEEQPQLHIQATDKDLYNLLDDKQKKKLVELVGVKPDDE